MFGAAWSVRRTGAVSALVVLAVAAAVLGVRLSGEETSVDALIAREVASAARRGSGDYRPPTREQAARLAAAVGALSRGDIAAAEGVDALGYEVRELEHGGRRLLVLAEAQSDRRHWGAFVVEPDAASDLLVEIPHPVSDLATPQVGLELFTRTGARALLIAGAHRDAGEDGSADVAHRTDSAFEAAHRVLLVESSVVVQLHGFDDGRRDDPAEVVLSDGTDDPPSRLEQVQDAVTDEGFEVCLFRGGPRCRDLAARTNVQGRSAREAGSVFVHVEAAPRLRQEREPRRRLVEALTASLARDPG